MKCTKNYRLSYTDKAKEIVDKLSLEQKVHLMSGTVSLEEMLQDMNGGKHYNYIPYPAGGIEEVGLDPMLFCDGPRGVVCGTGKSTCFPVSMLRGATFDTELEERIGQAITMKMLNTGLIAVGFSTTVREITTGLFLLIILGVSSNQGKISDWKAKKQRAKEANEKYAAGIM